MTSITKPAESVRCPRVDISLVSTRLIFFRFVRTVSGDVTQVRMINVCTSRSRCSVSASHDSTCVQNALYKTSRAPSDLPGVSVRNGRIFHVNTVPRININRPRGILLWTAPHAPNTSGLELMSSRFLFSSYSGNYFRVTAVHCTYTHNVRVHVYACAFLFSHGAI